MNDIVKDSFKSKAIVYGNMRLYFIRTMSELISFCEINEIRIDSIEAFSITGNGIQPSMANSVDFIEKENTWNQAREFIDNIVETKYVYEVWYEGY